MHDRRTLLKGAFTATALFGMVGVNPIAWALPPAALQFPRDHGAHTDFRTEWWYVTGYANTVQGEASHGFQVTFFRSLVPATRNMHSAFAARQLLFAHAAITDVGGRKLWHDQRIARWSGRTAGRKGMDMAWASETGMDILLRDWRLRETTLAHGVQPGLLTAQVKSKSLALDLRLRQPQALLLQGDQGLSRKGPETRQASYYYSRPQLEVEGTLTLQGNNLEVRKGSTAWLDHEWSQELLHPDAAGWDWIGINMFDGGALTAFRLRTGSGQALWGGGSFRTGRGQARSFPPGEVEFQPLRFWRSRFSGATYPVEWAVRTSDNHYMVKAVLDDQELDSRASTGAIYWEGLCELLDANGRLLGRGYLEMTGYAAALKLS